MIKLTITTIYPPKDVTTKYGVKQKASIKAQEHGDNYLSYWVSSSTRDWKVGDVIEVLSVDSREYNGKTYFDISMPKTSGGLPPEVAKSVEEIKTALTKHGLMLAQILEKLKTPEQRVAETKEAYPDLETPDGEIPF